LRAAAFAAEFHVRISHVKENKRGRERA